MGEFSVVMTSVDQRDVADRLIDAVLDARLAACVQIMPIESHYIWRGERQCGAEYLVIMKIKRAHYQALEALVRDHHSYETPEIICLDIERGYPPYLAWMEAVSA
jgi:periplasmic divalent cation tolerance protein